MNDVADGGGGQHQNKRQHADVGDERQAKNDVISDVLKHVLLALTQSVKVAKLFYIIIITQLIKPRLIIAFLFAPPVSRISHISLASYIALLPNILLHHTKNILTNLSL